MESLDKISASFTTHYISIHTTQNLAYKVTDDVSERGLNK